MKKIIFVVLIVVMVVSFTAFNKEEAREVTEKSKTVEVITIKEKNSPVILEYIGIVKSDEVKSIAFKSSGKINKIYVQKGDYVKKSEKLAEIDKDDLRLQLKASKSQLNAAKQDIKKAEDSYKFNKDSFEKIEKLYENNAISKDDYEKAKLNLETSEASFNQVKSNYEMAKVDYDYKLKSINDATITSDIEGYVLDVKYKEGEMVSAGVPVIIFRNDKMIVSTGVTQKDLEKIKIGDEAVIELNATEIKGIISNISQAPDKYTRTYEIEISIDDSDYYLETIVDVKFKVGSESGIWIPLSSILSSSIDYVYVVEDSRAVKKAITIENIRGNLAKVKGLKSGEQLVIKGMKTIKNGALLKVNDL